MYFCFLGEKSTKGVITDFWIEKEIVKNCQKGSNDIDRNDSHHIETQYDDRIDNSVCLSLNSSTISLQSKDSLKRSLGDSFFAVKESFEFLYPINRKVNFFISF